MSSFLVLLIACLGQLILIGATNGIIEPNEKVKTDTNVVVKEPKHEEPPSVKIENVKSVDHVEPSSTVKIVNKSVVNKEIPAAEVKNVPEMESGMLVRGTWVMVGLSFLFILYIGFRTYRKRNHVNVIVRKYGVRANRSDIEMEPLPLSDDDENETIFELRSATNNR